ncbi:MAG: hypothetical protein U5P10_14655 [Spirochaetia bacterium]|nr:hypothetical protein [Spirochaetia bacterium]
MGIVIELSVDFSWITQDQWTAVYEETLQLIEQYPFMEKIVDRDSYDETMIYADRTKERYLSPWYPDKLGWFTIGDLASFEHTETFLMFRDINYYKDIDTTQRDGDIYFSLLDHHGTPMPEIRALSTDGYHVFDGKTQGYDSHKYLLGIATLIEDRLTPHAVVSGDITRAQIQESVDWVNQYLEKPISLPDRCNCSRLLERIKRWVPHASVQIEMLFFLLLYPENNELGTFIRKNFSREIIRDYWKNYFKNVRPNTLGIHEVVESYLDMHFPIEDLCTILVSEDSTTGMTPRECIREILDSGIMEQQPESRLTPNNQSDPEPETIPSLFGKSYLAMAGFRDSTTQYMDEPQLKHIFYSVFQDKRLVDEVFEEYKPQGKPQDSGNILKEFTEKFLSRVSEGTPSKDLVQYDIEESEEIMHWKDGDSLHPDLAKKIQRVLDFSDSNIEELQREFGEKNENARIKALLRHNKYFLIRKETWDFILTNILDDTIYLRFLSLLSIDANEKRLNPLLKYICNNLNFLIQHMLIPIGNNN